jgi:WD40 repeat protein
VAVSPDGRSVLVGPGKGSSTAPDYRLRLLELETGADLAPPGAFAGHTETVQAVAFSPDCGNPQSTGCRALSSGLDKLVILWDVASGREIRRFVGHTAEVTQVAFSPGCDPALSDTTGRCIVLSAGGDGVVILWDMASGEALRRYEGHQGNVLGAVFTPGGRTILSAAVDSTVREWRMDLDYDDLVAWIAANRHVSELTCQQRVQYHVEPLCEETETGP